MRERPASEVSPAALEAAFGEHERRVWPALPGRTNHRLAGVLVPITWDPRPRAVLTLRAAHLSRHGGEVCFPGGRPDEGDADLWATATREAAEELALRGARRLGRLSSFPLYTSDFRLEPFVAEAPIQDYQPEPGEVAEVLMADLAGLLAQEAHDAIPYRTEGGTRLSPVFELEGHVCFGATAHALHELLEVFARAAGAELPPLVSGRFQWGDLLG